MVTLNTLLGKVYTQLAPTTDGAANRPGFVSQQSPAEGEKDRFFVGRYWQNRAEGESDMLGGAACRCGNCPACAAGAYGKLIKEQQTAAAEETQTTEGTTADTKSESITGEQKGDPAEAAGTEMTSIKGVDGASLSSSEASQLAELKKADIAVRAHEQAHLAAAGGLAKGAASLTYQKGPDGRRYAVGGEVQIDTSAGATPEETVSKMIQVRAAALAPADPSPQDRRVAQMAAMVMSEAKLELNTEKLRPEEQTGDDGQKSSVKQTEDDKDGVYPAGAGGSAKSDIATRVITRYLANSGGAVFPPSRRLMGCSG